MTLCGASPSNILRHLEDTDIVPLTMSLVQLTGDLSLLDLIAPYVVGAWSHQVQVPPETVQALHARLAKALSEHARGAAPAIARPDAHTAQKMMSAAVGEQVSDEYVPMLIEHMFADRLEAPALQPQAPQDRSDQS